MRGVDLTYGIQANNTKETSRGRAQKEKEENGTDSDINAKNIGTTCLIRERANYYNLSKC